MHTEGVVHEQGFRAVEIAHGGTRVVVLPELGGKIAELFMGGRQWLWHSDVLPFAQPVPSMAPAAYVETADSGGYDECFPTVGHCTLPASVPGFGGAVLPDHGELWSQPAQVDPGDGARSLRTTWTTRALPARFERTIVVEDDGAVRMHYRVTNTGTQPLPFLWSAHPLFALTPDTELLLPEGARTRVWASHGLDLAEGEHQWPRIRLADGRMFDASRPGFGAKGWALKVFLDMPLGQTGIRQGGVTLRCTYDVGEVPHFGLWLNHHGWAPAAIRASHGPYTNLAFEPCIGAGDTLSAALGAWQSAAWIDAGAVRAWTLVWRASER